MSADGRAYRRRDPPRRPRASDVHRPRVNLIPTLILAIGALYCVAPVLWILIASTKTNDELFSTPPF